MSLKATNKTKSNVPPLPGGVYTGICVGIVDMGEQYSERFKKSQNKIAFTFEVVGEFVDVEVDGKVESKPRWLSKTVTSSTNAKSKLTEIVESWRGREFSKEEEECFDVSSMIMQGCQLSVKCVKREDGSEYNEIASIMGLARGMEVGDPISDVFIFDIDDENTYSVLDRIPQWMSDMVKKSAQWISMHANGEKMSMDDDPPETADKPGQTRTKPDKPTKGNAPGF